MAIALETPMTYVRDEDLSCSSLEEARGVKNSLHRCLSLGEC